MGLYENMLKACRKHGTTLTDALRATGHSSGSTGHWKQGAPPRFDIFEDVAKYLDISLDELAYGSNYVEDKQHEWLAKNDINVLDDESIEWLNVMHNIPPEKRPICLDFLKTHMVAPESHAKGKMA